MTKRALLIAEKPSLMRAIRDAVNIHGFEDSIVYKAFAGHTMSLKMPNDYTKDWERMNTNIKDLPMIPEPFEYKPTKDKVSLYNDLKNEVHSGKYDYVINACDAGREGQHIFWSFYDEIGAPLPVKRIWSNDTTTDSLGKAMNNLRDQSDKRLTNMTAASKLRAQFDWLIGMNASRAFSERARAGIAVGRVMTPTLKLVVDRELEIQNFKPQTFYEVSADFDGYNGKYHEKENQGRFETRKEAQTFISSLSDKGTIKRVTRRKQVSKAPELFSLQTLQSEAGKQFGYTMSETLKIIQGLYDDGFLSYPRTDSSYVTKNTAATFPTLLKTVSKRKALTEKVNDVLADTKQIATIQKDSKYVNDKKVEDHDAILPTTEYPNRNLSKQEENVYDLVVRRFLSIFLPPLIIEKTKIVTDIDGNLFNTNGNVLVQKGFKELYNYNPKSKSLPSVKKDEVRTVKGTTILTGKTTAPKRYNSSSLGDAMASAGRFSESKTLQDILKEAKGIGTPATRGNIVEKLVYKKWISYKGKAKTIHASDVGISIIKALKDHDLVSVDLTAEWEDKLRNIEKDEMTPQEFEDEMIDYIVQTIREIETMDIKVLSAPRKSGSIGSSAGPCPICGKGVIIGKNVYFCDGYNPDKTKRTCSFVIGKKISGANLPATEMKKLLSGKETKILNMKSKKGNKFKAKLKWEKSSNKLEFVFPKKSSNNTFKTTKTDVKTTSGKTIKEDKFYWVLGKKKIGKNIWGYNVTPAQAKKLFAGEKIGPFKFTWKSGKSSKAKIYFDEKSNKIKYDFN